MATSSSIPRKGWAATEPPIRSTLGRRRNRPLTHLTFVVVLCALVLSTRCGRRTEAVVESPEERESQDLFVDYLKIDTSNPPGNETEAALFFQKRLASEGIESVLAGPVENRQSIVARLDSASSKPALVLLHHMDVVPAIAADWTMEPFGGEMANGYVWGRGSLDVKSLGVAHLMSILELHRRGDVLDRDVIFVGVADEEAGGINGTDWLLLNRPELFEGAGYVLNEGGANEVIVDRVAFWGIEFDQKVPLWVRLGVDGTRGHGAVPPDDGGAAAQLLRKVNFILAIERPYELRPTVAQYFTALAVTKRGTRQEYLADLDNRLEEPDLGEVLSPGYRSLLRTTIGLTQLRAGTAVNVIPTRAEAEIDIRLLPGESPEAMLDRIREIAGEDAEVEVLLESEPADPSSTDTELFRMIEKHLLRSDPGSVVGPLVSPGTTDCRFFRAKGIDCYGFSPFKVNYYDGNRVHGVDEKIRARFFAEGVALMRGIVRDFVTSREKATSASDE